MTDEILEELQTLPPPLPDVPDRLERVHRRARRIRRNRLLLVAAATAIAIAVPVAVVGQLSSPATKRPAPPTDSLDDVAKACPVAGLTVQPVPGTVQLTHTAEQAEAVVGAADNGAAPAKTLEVLPAMVRDPIAAKLRLGSPNVARPMWVIRQLVTVQPSPPSSAGSGGPPTRILVGTRFAQLRLVDDTTLTPALNTLCAPISATRGDVGFALPDNIRVAATGVIAPAGSGYVLCHTGGATAAGGGSVDGSWSGLICTDQVPLVGDLDSLEKLSGSTHDVTGIWRHDTLTVTSVGPPHEPALPDLTTPPCPTPPGGWGHVAPSKTPGLDDSAFRRYEHTHPGLITSTAYFWPAKLSPVLTLASTDPAATRSALEADYPRALCVVQSVFTAAQVSGARQEMVRAFNAHQLPGVYQFGGEGVSPQGQATLGMTALTDRPELHAALPDVPSNLLVIDTWIRQLS